MEQDIDIILDEIKRVQVLIRTNNLLISRFILELSRTRKELGLPKRTFFFKFELLQEEYEDLILEFGKKETDKALYQLDRMLLTNKQQCPNNIAKYIRTKIRSNLKRREQYRNEQ